MADEENNEPEAAVSGSLAMVVRAAANLPAESWNDERIDAILKTCAPPNTKRAQFAIFLATCHRYNLNPLTREIWLANMSGKIMVVTGRDAFVKIMNGEKDFRGLMSGTVNQNDEFAMTRDGDKVIITHKVVSFDRGPLMGGYAVIRREGKPDIVVLRRFDAFKHLQGKDSWKNYPEDMLETRCIVSAARKAYNLAGLEEQSAADEVLAQTSQVIDQPATGSAEAGTRNAVQEMKDRLGALQSRQSAPTFTPPAAKEEIPEAEVVEVTEELNGAPVGEGSDPGPDFETVADGGVMTPEQENEMEFQIRFSELDLLRQDDIDAWKAATTRMKKDDRVLYDRYITHCEKATS